MSHKTAVLFGLAALMIIWPVFIEWLRHRSFKKTQCTAFHQEGTQHLVIIGTAGMVILIIVSLCVATYYVFR